MRRIANWGEMMSYQQVMGNGFFFSEVECPHCEKDFLIKVNKVFFFEVDVMDNF
jgi:predicted P-loop ATPase